MTQDEVDSFAERMKAAKVAKAAERAEAEGSFEPDAEPKPKRRYAKRKTARKPRAASTKPPSLRAPVEAMLETVGGVWHMQETLRGHEPLDESHPTCGSVLLECAPGIAKNLNLLAQSDPTVYRWLDRMMAGGGWGGVVLATWPVAAAVLQAHVMPRFQRVPEEQLAVEQAETWPPEQPS